MGLTLAAAAATNTELAVSTGSGTSASNLRFLGPPYSYKRTAFIIPPLSDWAALTVAAAVHYSVGYILYRRGRKTVNHSFRTFRRRLPTPTRTEVETLRGLTTVLRAAALSAIGWLHSTPIHSRQGQLLSAICAKPWRPI